MRPVYLRPPHPLTNAPLPKRGCLPHPGRGRVPGAWPFFFFFLFFSCTAWVAVCDSLVRPFRQTIPGALSSPCASQQALAFEGFPMRDNVRCSPVTRAARSPVTSPVHRTCAVSRAGQPERIVPGTRSTRSANRTHGVQHVMPRTRAHMRTRCSKFIQPSI